MLLPIDIDIDMYLQTEEDTYQPSFPSPVQQKKNPRACASSTIIHTPAQFDVLCCRCQDRKYSKHPGNQAYRGMIETFVPEYIEAGTKVDKMNMTRQIVSTMQIQFGARFLKPNEGGGWQEVSDSMARDKTSHALRWAAKQTKTRGNRKRSRSYRASSSTGAGMKKATLNKHSMNAAPSFSKESTKVRRVESIFERQQSILKKQFDGGWVADDHELKMLQNEFLEEIDSEPVLL